MDNLHAIPFRGLALSRPVSRVMGPVGMVFAVVGEALGRFGGWLENHRGKCKMWGLWLSRGICGRLGIAKILAEVVSCWLESRGLVAEL